MESSFELREEYIPLNALMKVLAWVPSGGEANTVITQGLVQVNGEEELRKRRKMRAGDVVDFMGNTAKVLAPETNE